MVSYKSFKPRSLSLQYIYIIRLSSFNDATGYMVYCEDLTTACNSTEQPAAHGKTVKAAYETLIEKWDFAIKDRGVKNTKVK